MVLDVENPVEELLCITVKNQSNKQIITGVLVIFIQIEQI